LSDFTLADPEPVLLAAAPSGVADTDVCDWVAALPLALLCATAKGLAANVAYKKSVEVFTIELLS
jgi:hypothetical protein